MATLFKTKANVRFTRHEKKLRKKALAQGRLAGQILNEAEIDTIVKTLRSEEEK